ncbi:MAG: AMP-binding protein [Verrucomicrobia bacterium]|nr:AMP-binding protein [Verrucomicrobiota bacterium]MCH8527890.1 AMP-binding protein [Kiritimatiellia bacterium]
MTLSFPKRLTQLDPARTALRDATGSHTYGELLEASARFAGILHSSLVTQHSNFPAPRIAFLVTPGFEYVLVQWAVWRAGGIAVPLCIQHPEPELRHVVEDSGAEILVASREYADRLTPLLKHGQKLILSSEWRNGALVEVSPPSPGDGAMMIYTSGTTGKPKGALTTHAGLAAQIRSLSEAWEWTPEDRILLFLPLHHVHGVVNVLGCALWNGAFCDILSAFDAETVWRRVCDGDLTVFMAVPTIYARLLAAWDASDEAERKAFRAGCGNMRLMVSGSAALPAPMFHRWREISGHTLLERYGMTEIGMALSNPLHGERLPGTVGTPLPGVEARLDRREGEEAGEIQVRGPAVFAGYWNRPEATAESFTADGWFKTGDIAVCENGVYRILGRNSVDIIKSGGFKISALEIETELLGYPEIEQAAVVGVPDPEWGERVAAAVVLKAGCALTLSELRARGKSRLAVYKLPSRLKVVEGLPRNAMGKVVKPEVKKLFRKTLLLIGSSIMEQWGQPDELAPDLRVLNRAVGGSITTDWIDRIAPLLREVTPDFLLCYVGSNDVGRGRKREEIVRDLLRVREQITCPFGYLSIIKCPQRDGRHDEIAEVCAAIRGALPPEDLWIDTDPVFLPGGQPVPEYYVEDQLHLTSGAYTALLAYAKPRVAVWVQSGCASEKRLPGGTATG